MGGNSKLNIKINAEKVMLSIQRHDPELKMVDQHIQRRIDADLRMKIKKTPITDQLTCLLDHVENQQTFDEIGIKINRTQTIAQVRASKALKFLTKCLDKIRFDLKCCYKCGIQEAKSCFVDRYWWNDPHPANGFRFVCDQCFDADKDTIIEKNGTDK